MLKLDFVTGELIEILEFKDGGNIELTVFWPILKKTNRQFDSILYPGSKKKIKKN